MFNANSEKYQKQLDQSLTNKKDTIQTELRTELQEKFDRLVEQLEQQRQTFHVPGMAIAVVKDDEVILSHGFGVANIEEQTPVTPETIFAIGSTTKAFTSTLVGMLVDEGKMDWDDRVSKYLPYFKMNVKSDNESKITFKRPFMVDTWEFFHLYLKSKIPSIGRKMISIGINRR